MSVIKTGRNKKPVSKKQSNRHAKPRPLRPLHRRLSLHPVTIMLLLCIGVLMIGATVKAFGTSSTVSLRITDAPLVEPARIVSPPEQSVFTVPDITVDGTCPDSSYVKLYKNEVFSGVAECRSGKFSLIITLSVGTNQLSARVYNFSDEQGPVSDAVTVYYNPPQTTTTTDPARPKQPLISPQEIMHIVTDFTYKVHRSGQPIQLDLALVGGNSPYAWAVNWNDDKITPIARSDRLPFQAEHQYGVKPRLYTYVIKVAVSDVDGNTDYIQLMAVIDGSEAANTPGSSATTPGIINDSYTWLKYVWPIYIIVVLMVLSFYLGEREEYRILTRKNKLMPR